MWVRASACVFSFVLTAISFLTYYTYIWYLCEISIAKENFLMKENITWNGKESQDQLERTKKVTKMYVYPFHEHLIYDTNKMCVCIRTAYTLYI